ncbi:hypothetical protein V6U90_16460 [Micromonospora sp. CPCC 206060]|uniref:hypothetical protein n=1 Tax=Micromonospora sp. CPCC 206060 TaxID=3122406 RepID=UPI002FF342F2
MPGDPGVMPSSAVPLVVIPEPVNRQRPRFDQSVRELWAQAEASLGALLDMIGRSGGTPVDKHFRFAVESLGTLGRRLAALAPVEGAEQLPPPVPVHSDYFRVRHTALTPEQQAAQAVVNTFRTLADLRLTMLEINDVLAELTSMAALLELLRPEPDPAAGVPAERANGRVTEQSWFEPTGDWLDRWFLVHHFYFLLNVHTADELRRACELVEAGDDAAATRALTSAATLIRGFTAAMIHSGALPARYYQEVIRPTMAPPFVRINLTGVMQLEHRRYRAAVDELLRVLPEPYADMYVSRPQLAAARDEVLEADLLDLERHVTLAAVLVGNDRSLVQPGKIAQNATSMLREMRHLRATKYCPLMQFGDQWLNRMPR